MPAEPPSFPAETLNEIFDAVPNAMLVKDEDHRWIFVSETLCREMGRSRSELLHRTDFDLLPPGIANKNCALDDLVLANGEPSETEAEYPLESGGRRTVLVRKRRVYLPRPNGETAPAVVVVMVDVTRFRRAEENALYLALHDPLTGMPNRSFLRQRLNEALELARRDMGKFALFMVDLDGFKSVNDSLGHVAGDEIFRMVGSRLMCSVRAIDTVARLGGDEFAIVQRCDDLPSGIISFADRISNVLSEPYQLAQTRVTLSASVGISIFPDHGQDPDVLMQRADTALYAIKNTGKHGYALVHCFAFTVTYCGVRTLQYRASIVNSTIAACIMPQHGDAHSSRPAYDSTRPRAVNSKVVRSS